MHQKRYHLVSLKCTFLYKECIPVNKDDTCDKECHAYSKEIGKWHLVRQMLQRAVRTGSNGHGCILPSTFISAVHSLRAVTVVPVVHHCVREISLKHDQMEACYYRQMQFIW